MLFFYLDQIRNFHSTNGEENIQLNLLSLVALLKPYQKMKENVVSCSFFIK